jgi:hypothetical protein
MSMFGSTAGLPVVGPLRGLIWLARQVAAAAEQEMNDPARLEAALLALERRLTAGEIDEAAFEAEEAVLLARLASPRAAEGEGFAGSHLPATGGIEAKR